MKTLTSLLLFLGAVTMIAGQSTAVESQTITISGRVLYHDANPELEVVTVYINDIGNSSQLSFPAKLDAEGRFTIHFNRYLPQDVMIKYRTLFRVIVHPGDHLNVQFDGRADDRVELFKTVQFSGDDAALNQQLSQYLSHYYTTRYDLSENTQQQQDLQPDEYRAYRDSLYQVAKQEWQQYLAANELPEELVRWTKYELEMDRINDLLLYIFRQRMHRRLGAYQKVVEPDYFSFLEDLPILDVASLINTSVSKQFVNYFHHGYVNEHFRWNILEREAEEPGYRKRMADQMDSLKIQAIITHSEGQDLLRALVLSEYINEKLEKKDISTYEEYWPVIDAQVPFYFLRNPLAANYQATKYHLEHPNISSESWLNNLTQLDNKLLLDSILNQNRGKVLYLDIWAIWCGPCIAEFPKSVSLHRQLEEVAFAYLCIDSEEDQWKATLSQYDLSGDHYLVNKNQSAFLRKDLNFSGIPHYLVFDKEGSLVASGSHLRPSSSEIKGLLQDLLEESED